MNDIPTFTPTEPGIFAVLHAGGRPLLVIGGDTRGRTVVLDGTTARTLEQEQERFYLTKDSDPRTAAEGRAMLRERALREAQTAARAAFREDLLHQLETRHVVPEAVPPFDYRETAKRREILDDLAAEGFGYWYGARRRCLLPSRKSSGFTPAKRGSRMLVAGAQALHIPNGRRTLVGVQGDLPAVLRWLPDAAPEVVVLDERALWTRFDESGLDPEVWMVQAKARLEDAAELTPDEVRSELLATLKARWVITPETDPERMAAAQLAAEGWARRTGSSFVLARTPETD